MRRERSPHIAFAVSGPLAAAMATTDHKGQLKARLAADVHALRAEIGEQEAMRYLYQLAAGLARSA